MTSRTYFGTDGIRGVANAFPMTPEVALKVGQAAGQYFRAHSVHDRPSVLIGKDTRLSGYMVESALQAGFTSVGFSCLLVGPMPTPAVAFLTRSLRADLGVMISASHNPYMDNGIKLFGPDGFKLPDDVEKILEQLMDGGACDCGTGHMHKVEPVEPEKIGKALRVEDAAGRYIEFCKTAVSTHLALDGLKIVIDCANGAAYKIAPRVLWELGAQVVRLGAEPDGMNINKGCGALEPDALRKAVLAHGADIGIALDGDADRLMLCDEKGVILDGDQILASISSHMHKQGTLRGGKVVATQMSNMGLEQFLEGHGLGLVRTKVGDRYVVEAMRAGGYNVGGESSGHVVLLDHGTTGDGLVAGLRFLEAMRETGKKASELGNCYTPFPQKLKNIRLSGGISADDLLADADVKTAISFSENALQGVGRVLIRKSGTEPLVRVMVEAKADDLVEAHLSALSGRLQERLGVLTGTE